MRYFLGIMANLVVSVINFGQPYTRAASKPPHTLSVSAAAAYKVAMDQCGLAPSSHSLGLRKYRSHEPSILPSAVSNERSMAPESNLGNT